MQLYSTKKGTGQLQAIESILRNFSFIGDPLVFPQRLIK